MLKIQKISSHVLLGSQEHQTRLVWLPSKSKSHDIVNLKRELYDDLTVLNCLAIDLLGYGSKNEIITENKNGDNFVALSSE